MKKILVIFIAMLSLNAVFSSNASATDWDVCNRDDRLKFAGIAAAIGATAGAVTGFAVIASIPVGTTAGISSIAYFPGTAAFGTWLTHLVLPTMAGSAVLTGAVFGLVASAGFTEQCQKKIEATLQRK